MEKHGAAGAHNAVWITFLKKKKVGVEQKLCHLMALPSRAPPPLILPKLSRPLLV